MSHYKNPMFQESAEYLLSTNLGRQVYLHGNISWPVTHSEDVDGQLDVAGNVLALHVLEKEQKRLLLSFTILAQEISLCAFKL